ncbi:MAG: hypothetical protein OXM61_03750, partial [Candidatus Poribacteria bacterium]|nr:hypothetical protein [Candidatus Poribacteria bacterium]
YCICENKLCETCCDKTQLSARLCLRQKVSCFSRQYLYTQDRGDANDFHSDAVSLVWGVWGA